MEILLLFQPFSRGLCLDYVADVAKNRFGLVVEKVFDWGLRAIIKLPTDDISTVMELAKAVTCISSLYIVHKYVKSKDLNAIIAEAVEAARKLFSGRDVCVEVRRWDKTFQLKSVDVARSIAKANEAEGVAKPTPKSSNTLFVGIEKDFVVVAYATKDITDIFSKEGIALDLAKNIIVAVESVKTDYEIMDLVQLSRALGFKLRLFKPNRKVYEKVLHILGLDSIENVEIVESVDDVFKEADVAIALSMYAREGERKLAEIAKAYKGRKILIILGNEYEDVSLELRKRCLAEIRLGPLTGFAMRTTTALAYALGIIFYVQSNA